MSDRLPGRKSGPRAPVATGPGHSGESPGVNGASGDGGAGCLAPETPGVRFLLVNGVLGPSDPADDVDSEFSQAYPACWEYLTVRVFRGSPRQTSTILFFREDGQWKVCLSDRDTDRVLFRSGDSVSDCFEALEKALASPRADWRASRRSRRQ